MSILKMIDHTLLKQNLEKGQLEKHCHEAVEYGFFSVMVQPLQVKKAKEFLKDSGVLVGTVIAFPFGEELTEVKVFQAKTAVQNGADEIDMVMCISKLKEGDFEYVINDIKSVLGVLGGKALKVIIETCLLECEEIEKACECCILGGASFVKTSTGFFEKGATVEDVLLMKETCLDIIKIKASGGIKTLEDAKALIDAGANRIGTSSSVEIAKSYNESLSET